jgi:hypothetical protein
MSGNETGVEDIKIIKFFESQIAWRKASPDRELWLTNLKEIYEVLPQLSTLLLIFSLS